MAQVVLGIGTSHTPMLNAPVTDWPRFIERDSLRPHLDKAGKPATYAQLVASVDGKLADQLTPEVFASRHAAAMRELERLRAAVRNARLDSLVIVGDDQMELFNTDNLPSILVYHGRTMRNVPLTVHPGPPWARSASAQYFETDQPREYPVDVPLANHLIATLMDQEFDVSVADQVREGMGEGHAFGFVRKKLLGDASLPVVPIFLNTYYPPNQPTPKRCYRLGQVMRQAIESLPGNQRIGVIASGGLTHFTIDEQLDQQVVAALRAKDAAALCALPKALLNSGNSEIRNWICMAGATEHLQLRSLEYIPAYRTPAGTGTGLCFASWD